MMWIKSMFRLLLMILAPVILFIPTLYATARNLDRLPWGLDYIFGCREDGWNGTGCDPAFPRVFWRNVDGETVQGWWPDYLGVIWSKKSFIYRWLRGFQWCALRNVAWNLRLNDWFGTSIHFKDIRVVWFEENPLTKEAIYIWYGKNGKKFYKKRQKIFGVLLEYGYEFYPEYFDEDHQWYRRVRNHGYTFNVAPFKDRSIPSIRPRFKK